MSAPQLGRVGIWSLEMRFGDPAESIEAAAELDDLGFGALWIPGGIDSGVLKSVDALLAATKRITIATGILNIWKHDPKDVAAWFAGLSEDHKSRTMLGLGVSHGPIIGEAGNVSTDLSRPACPVRTSVWRRWGQRCWNCPVTAPQAPTPTL